MLTSDKLSSPSEQQLTTSIEQSNLLLHFDAAIMTMFVVNIVKRHFIAMFVIVFFFLSFGILYLYFTPPRFTATGTLLIDIHKNQKFAQQLSPADNILDPQEIPTEIEVLKSPKIIMSVVKDLKLIVDPEFVRDAFSSSHLMGLSGKAPSEQELEDRAVAGIKRQCSISRLGQTYVVEVSCHSLNPEKSAKIVNSIINAYVGEQIEARSQAARRASLWLQERLRELRTQSAAAEQAVVDYKRDHNIVDLENNNGKKRSINEQQISEANSQLTSAHVLTTEAKARLDRIDAIMAEEVPNSSVADSLKNEVIIRLRNRYVDMAAREHLLSAKYGQDHLVSANLRAEMIEVKQNIIDEMNKIRESYKSDYQIASEREKSAERALEAAISSNQSTNQAQVELQGLESTSQSYRAIYDNSLQGYLQAVQQQSFPISETRLIGEATIPTKKSGPLAPVVLGISTVAGLFACLAFGCYREFSDRVFRTKAQVERTLGTSRITTLPMLPANMVSTTSITQKTKPREIVFKEDIMTYVLGAPFSHYAESLRSLKLNIDITNRYKNAGVIGITSTLPNEGKSTIASNLAHLLAQAGSRVLLVDCDFRKPSLSRRFVPDATAGLIDLIINQVALADIFWSEPSTHLLFLPVGSCTRVYHPGEIFSSVEMGRVINQLRTSLDYVVLDLPPLLPVIDARAIANFVDSYLYVIEWGKTRRKLVESLLLEAPEIYDRLAGVILNRVNEREMALREGEVNPHYYRKYYGEYNYTE
ncbi:MAG TPA: AAA family ATPase [Methylocella sp.]|nr:AAA family ATPase [Methylocella sp.]